ncbi:CPBP family intramembrane glutamic endopeptidase [Chitinophaga deserti]|uniref:CPBP family intramembrane glutamic endopeptidase n=1 Tax=Chitinophaga deserti TaxID=2164099 RepID=UPI0013007374|nr:type II CAAX endopeptidase family protein [Chitinophaga deserti]
MYVKTRHGLSLNGAWRMQIALFAGWIIPCVVVFLASGLNLLQFPVVLSWLYLLGGVSVILCVLIRKRDNFQLAPRLFMNTELFVLCISMAIALVIVKDGLGSLLPLPIWSDMSFTSIQAGSAVMVICTVALMAMMEEILFRGIIMEALLYRYSGSIALLQSSLLYMLAHPDPAQMPGAFLLGLLSGSFYLRFRDLCPSMLLHISHNAAAALLLNVGSQHFAQDSPFAYYIMVAGCIAALAGGYVLMQRIPLPKTKAAPLQGKPLLHPEKA